MTCGLRLAGCGLAACALQAVQKAGEWIKAMGTLDPAAYEVGDPARVAWGPERGHDQRAGHFHAPGDMPKMHSQNVHAQHVHAQSVSRIVRAALPTGAFMVAKAVGGLLAGSLALLADAPMLIDAVSLALGRRAFCIARQRTYGFHLSRWAAYSNGLSTCAPCART